MKIELSEEQFTVRLLFGGHACVKKWKKDGQGRIG